MGGQIYLDPDYNSGVPGHPGTRFVVDLKQPPIKRTHEIDPLMNELLSNSRFNGKGSDRDSTSTLHDLPEYLSVLFVDDDPVLRKLFMRTTKTVAPNWEIREASNGEAALRLTEGGEHFDLIFVDMYMASVEKQLLGTETVSELRNRGIKSRICGLSANDKEEEFIGAGANAFMFKPFPCKSDELTDALCHVLFDDPKSASEGLAIFES